MSGTSSVPSPSWGPNGFIAPEETDILAGVLADLNAAFGGNLNPALDTPQGQLASSLTAIIGDKNDQFLRYTNQVDPAYAEGRMQDAIARIYFIERDPARATVTVVTCIGAAGVVIPVGALIQASDGNLYSCTQAGTIPSGGSIDLPFACAVTGPLACPAQTFAIYQTIPGWDTAISADPGVLGNLVESQAAFEERRRASVALNGHGSIQSIRAAVLSLPGVLDVYAVENTSGSTVTIGGVSLVGHSIYVAVVGGVAQAIGEAIWSKKDNGASYNGNTAITVYDTSYDDPQPSYQVLFQVPDPTAVYVRVRITNGTSVPSSALSQIQAAVINAFSGSDGGSRARIGGTIYASRFYGPVATLGAWARIVDIQVSLNGSTWTDTVSLDIDQAPSIAASNISLVLV
jgi:uncharacterized phage protein gp47/JayE